MKNIQQNIEESITLTPRHPCASNVPIFIMCAPSYMLQTELHHVSPALACLREWFSLPDFHSSIPDHGKMSVIGHMGGSGSFMAVGNTGSSASLLWCSSMVVYVVQLEISLAVFDVFAQHLH